MTAKEQCHSKITSIDLDDFSPFPLRNVSSEDPSVSNITDIESFASQLDPAVDSPRSVSSLSFTCTNGQQSFPKTKSSQILNAVVKLNVTHCDPNYGQPWQMRRQGTSTSSGFILPGRKLITNSHSVVHATVIRVQKRTTDQKFSARLIARADECDLALLTVDDDMFWKDIVPLQLGRQPELNDAVAVAGYPHGGSNISVTAGVVSRVELIPYSNVDSLLGIQIDAAVNPGNSGGPALNLQNEVVGVAFQSMKGIDAENIGYLVPESVLQHFLVDVERQGRYTGFCDFGFKWQTLENEAFRRYLKMVGNDSGVVVRQLSPLSDAARVLKENDIITKVDGFNVSNAGTVPDSCGQRISFHSIVTKKFVGDMLNLKILRDGQPLEVEYKLSDSRSLTLVPVFPADGRPEYVMIGGLVFLALTEPYLQSEYGRKGVQKLQFISRWLSTRK